MKDKQAPLLFVSHHSSQLGVAEHVERALNARGVQCWVAPRDVEPGTSFARAIPHAIADSDAVLLLFCSNSVKSRHVERELILADQLGKTIIPLRLERIDPGELSYHLASSQWIDWLEQRDAAIERIASRTFDLRGRQEPTPPPPADVWDEQDTQRLYPAAPPPTSGPPGAPAPPPPPESPPQWNRAPGEGGGDPQPQWGWSPSKGSHAPPQSHPAPARSKAPWIVLGVFALLALIAVIVLVTNSGSSPSGNSTVQVVTPTPSTTPTTPTTGTESTPTTAEPTAPSEPAAGPSDGNITEEWFAGVWSDERNCGGDTYRFDLGGILTLPNGTQADWAIEGGNTLVVSAPDGTEERLVMRAVSNDEVIGFEGSSYRCL